MGARLCEAGQPHDMNSKTFINIFIIIVSIVVLAGISLAASPTTISQIDASSWKTYVSERDGYEIQFPKTYICPEVNLRICADQNSRVIYEHLRLYSDDIRSDDEWPPTLSFEIDGLKQKSAKQDFFEHINSQRGSPANQRSISKITKIHNVINLNGHKMIKVESIQDNNPVTLYLIEKNSTQFIRIFLAKLKPEEANKRSQEIDAIISSFKFNN